MDYRALWKPPESSRWGRSCYQRLYLHLLGKARSPTEIARSFRPYTKPTKYPKDYLKERKGGVLPEYWCDHREISKIVREMEGYGLVLRGPSNSNKYRSNIQVLEEAIEVVKTKNYDFEEISSYIRDLNVVFERLWLTDDIYDAFCSICESMYGTPIEIGILGSYKGRRTPEAALSEAKKNPGMISVTHRNLDLAPAFLMDTDFNFFLFVDDLRKVSKLFENKSTQEVEKIERLERYIDKSMKLFKEDK